MATDVAAIIGATVIAGGALGLGLREVARSIKREQDTRYRRTEAWLAIYSVIKPVVPFRPIQPWQATPELLRLLVQLMLEQKPGLVLELGSGLSTVLAAYCVELTGRGRIVSVDSEARFCQATQDLLRIHGLERHVRLVQAPLVPVDADGHQSRWYDPRAIRDALDQEAQPIGLMLVDGPPGKDQPLARLPAVPLMHDRLSPTAVILVDDARRKDEQAMVAQWTNRYQGFVREDLATEKGTIILRKN